MSKELADLVITHAELHELSRESNHALTLGFAGVALEVSWEVGQWPDRFVPRHRRAVSWSNDESRHSTAQASQTTPHQAHVDERQ